MDSNKIKNCSYNELKQIAVEHDLLKSIKSKKKAVLLEKILDFFSERTDITSTTDAKNEEDSPEKPSEVIDSKELVRSKPRRGKKNRDKKLKAEVDKQVEVEVEELPSGSGRKTKATNEATSEETESTVKPQKSKKTRSKNLASGSSEEELLEEVSSTKTSPSDDVQIKKRQRGKKARSKDLKDNHLREDEEVTSGDSSGGSNRRGTFVVKTNKTPTSDEDEIPEKRKASKRARSKDLKKELISQDEDIKKEDALSGSDRRGTFVVKTNKTPTSDEDVIPEKRQASKRTRSKDLKKELISDDEDIKKEDSLSSSDRRGTFIDQTNKTPTSDEVVIPEMRQASKRTRSKDAKKELISEDEDVKKENSLIKTPPSDDVQTKKRQGRKKARSKDVKSNHLRKDEEITVANSAGGSDRTGTFVVKTNKTPTSDEDIIPEKRQASKRTRSKDLKKELISEDEDIKKEDSSSGSHGRGKFDIKTSKSPKSNDVTKEEPKTSKRTRFEDLESAMISEDEDINTENVSIAADELLNNQEMTELDAVKNLTPEKIFNQKLPKGTVSAANRRGTFTVATPKPANGPTTPKTPLANITMLGANVKNISFSSSKRAMHKIRTPKITTPKTLEKAISKSALKKGTTPSKFSATKMPNFSLIHKKNFEKMESLVSYSARTSARKQLGSSLNKSFSGLTAREGVKKNDESVRQQVKSFIPIRSKSVHLEEKKDRKTLTALVNKTRVTNVEKIREKERDIIKGVRANKRFMLQMKMRKIDV